MQVLRQLRQGTLAVSCKDELERQARDLLEVLAELDANGPSLADGSTIRFGWSLLTLHAEGERLAVHEPDFLGNALQDQVQGADTTFQVLTEQVAVLRRLKVEPAAAAYDSTVLIAKHCLGADDVYLERKAPAFADDSGWYIGPVTADEERGELELESRYVYELLRLRPALMQVLAFPQGYLAMFHGDSIVAIVNEHGENVLRT